MTAYATLAAALAAFLSVKTAQRQDRATFTSTLHSKQVDVLESFETRIGQFFDISEIKQSDEQRNLSASNYQKIESSYNEMIKSLVTLEIVYPTEVKLLLENIIMIARDRMHNVMSNFGGQDYEIHQRNTFLQLARALSVLDNCSKVQLREGEYIDGQRFKLCVTAQGPLWR
jgi:hypothetical protein